jgi:phosphoglucomutase
MPGISPRLKFGTSGWRAVIADEFTFSNARRAVAGIARHLESAGRTGLLLIGHDTRFLADRFAAEAARLLNERGFATSVSARPVPTPVLSFEIVRRRAAGGLNFTASHNPPRYLGLKFSGPDGAPALPEVTRAIEKEIAKIGEVAPPAETEIETFDPVPAYLARLSEIVDPRGFSRFPLGLDFRFGTSAGYLDRFFEEGGAEVSKIHDRPDPLFGGQSPQCSARELAELAKFVRRSKLALGLATDGDADRFGILDERGRYLAPNSVLALLARDLYGRTGSKKGIARSVATTHALDAVAKRFGAPLYETPVGFKFIGELLLEGKILMGGEESAGLTIEGHVPDKDGILADALFARAVRESGKTPARLRKDLEKEIGPFHSDRLDLPLDKRDRKKLAARRKSPPSSFGGRRVENVNRLDGLKLILEGGSWILFRESGTEPLVRVYTEAASAAEVSRLLKEGRKFLEE